MCSFQKYLLLNFLLFRNLWCIHAWTLLMFRWCQLISYRALYFDELCRFATSPMLVRQIRVSFKRSMQRYVFSNFQRLFHKLMPPSVLFYSCFKVDRFLRYLHFFLTSFTFFVFCKFTTSFLHLWPVAVRKGRLQVCWTYSLVFRLFRPAQTQTG